MAHSVDLIALKSDKGRELLEDVKVGRDCVFQPFLFNIFKKQETGFTCGIASSAMIMSAKTGRTRDLPYIESNMFSFLETTSVITWEKIKKDGSTMEEVAALLSSHGCDVTIVHAINSTAEVFRNDAVAALSKADSSTGVIVNYHTGTLGQGTEFGHHSPPLCISCRHRSVSDPRHVEGGRRVLGENG